MSRNNTNNVLLSWSSFDLETSWKERVSRTPGFPDHTFENHCCKETCHQLARRKWQWVDSGNSWGSQVFPQRTSSLLETPYTSIAYAFLNPLLVCSCVLGQWGSKVCKRWSSAPCCWMEICRLGVGDRISVATLHKRGLICATWRQQQNGFRLVIIFRPPISKESTPVLLIATV